MSESKKQIDINIIIRLDDQFKEKLLSADITVEESGKITTPLSVAHSPISFVFSSTPEP